MVMPRRQSGGRGVSLPDVAPVSFVQPAPLARRVESIGNTETLFLTGELVNPTAEANLVEFTVPQGFVATIDALAVQYSNLFIAQARTVGWMITVNGGQVSNVRATGSDSLFYFNIGDVGNPMYLRTPLFVNGGATVAIRIVPIAGFGEALIMFGVMSGSVAERSKS